MIYLNIGSNLTSIFGDRFENIRKSLSLLSQNNIEIIKVSNFYETPSYPDKKKPMFANIGLLAKYNFSHTKLMKEIILIEKKIGRVLTNINEPRVCDIDIIDFNGLVLKRDNLQIPHPRLHLRNFVLFPLKEINTNWTHPISKKKIDLLLSQLSQNSRIQITRLDKSAIIS